MFYRWTTVQWPGTLADSSKKPSLPTMPCSRSHVHRRCSHNGWHFVIRRVIYCVNRNQVPVFFFFPLCSSSVCQCAFVSVTNAISGNTELTRCFFSHSVEETEKKESDALLAPLANSSTLVNWIMGANMGKNASLLDSLPSTHSTLHIVMLGLDSAGKTTALYRLKFDQYVNTVPTIGFNCEKIRALSGRAKGTQFLVWDVGNSPLKISKKFAFSYRVQSICFVSIRAVGLSWKFKILQPISNIEPLSHSNGGGAVAKCYVFTLRSTDLIARNS